LLSLSCHHERPLGREGSAVFPIRRSRRKQQQILRGLKPARDDKNKELNGAPFGRLRAGSKVRPFKTPAETGFFSSL
jgi:hypothetical protein